MDLAVVGVLLLLVGGVIIALQTIREEDLERAVRGEDIRWGDIIGDMEMDVLCLSGRTVVLMTASTLMLSLCAEIS